MFSKSWIFFTATEERCKSYKSRKFEVVKFYVPTCRPAWSHNYTDCAGVLKVDWDEWQKNTYITTGLAIFQQTRFRDVGKVSQLTKAPVLEYLIKTIIDIMQFGMLLKFIL